MEKVRIGIVGIGSISGIYLENITNMFKEIEVYAVCDKIKQRAQDAYEKYSIPKIYDTMDELFADENVDIVLNLTRPYEHYEVSKAALLANKHVYSEKPLAASIDEGRELVELAQKQNRMLGGAPDTFMGAGIQTCRKLIDDGVIGDVVAASASLLCRGHETWHPDPEFYYKYGGGPMMDMGPYYITALINLIGGVDSVFSYSKASFKQRMITSAPHYGEIIDVDVNTHIAGLINFDNGAIANITTSFDVYHDRADKIEIYGSKGTMYVPDPNGFGGDVKVVLGTDDNVKVMPLMFDYPDNSRALGLADMAKAFQTGREFRPNYTQTLHVLEIMESFRLSSEQNAPIKLKSKFTRFAPMSNDKTRGVL